MALTLAQRALLEKARALGTGGQAVGLNDGACRFLLAVIAKDLGLSDRFPELAADVRPFFSPYPLNALELDGPAVSLLFERLLSLDANVDTYFACLAALHKARLKYERILAVQPVPTVDQVGPRSLLQFGTMKVRALNGFLFWRKWMFDIDNRAGQETGYLFEPIIAAAIGGSPAPARKSPVKRRLDGSKGRQVDCIRDGRAYELKLRVTIAASGQGRWAEELDFPEDCRASGYVPVLVVLDPTDNPKLAELRRAFLASGGEVYVGTEAWRHLESTAGPTLGRFLKNYVHGPISKLLDERPDGMPELSLKLSDTQLTITVDGEVFTARRSRGTLPDVDESAAELPEDADEEIGAS